MVRQRPSLGYSLNVFPDETLEELFQTLRLRATRLRRELCGHRPFPIELRFSQQMAEALQAQPERLAELRCLLRDEGLRLITLNAFVPISFHQPNLKERVYQPTWHENDDRVRYTCLCADLLAALAPDDLTTLNLSVPAGILKQDAATTPDVHDRIATALRRCAAHCRQLEQRTGKRIIVSLEPEPGLTYERTGEVVDFFRQFHPALEGETGSGRYLGINFDVCHQLVEFEDPAASIAALQQAAITVAKVHVSNCIEIEQPLIAPELMEALRQSYAESKFLHQTSGINAEGRLVYFSLDLPAVLTPSGLRALAHAGVEKIRIHYHMPLLPGGNMPTTLKQVEAFVRQFAKAQPEVPLVIETYTWMEQLAAAGKHHADLIDRIADEIRHVRGWL